MNRSVRLVAPAIACLLLVGCGSLSRLSEVGRAPAMTPTADPTKDPTWRPVTMPMPAREPTPNEVNAPPDAKWTHMKSSACAVVPISSAE